MRLRLDGSETRFEDAYRRAPFSELIRVTLSATDALLRLGHAGKWSHPDRTDPGPGGPLPTGG